MRYLIPVVVLTGIISSQTARATDAADIDPFADDSFWVLQTGLEFDDESAYVVTGGLSYQHSAQTFAAFNLGMSDSSVDQVNLKSTYASVLLDHSFGAFGGSVALGWSGDADTVERFRYGGSLYFKNGGFRLEIIAEDWTSDFDTFEFSSVIVRDRPLSQLAVAGTADCDLDSTAFGGHVRYSRDAWSIYGAATGYDYSSADCNYTGSLGGIGLRNPPDVLADFAPVFFRRLALATASKIINSEAAFLDKSYSAGLSFWLGDKSLALDYFHSEEIFEGLTADTFLGSFLFPLGSQADVELRLGATDHELSDVVLFVGGTIYWYFGGG